MYFGPALLVLNVALVLIHHRFMMSQPRLKHSIQFCFRQYT